MATEKTYNGDGSDTTFDITFPYLTHADIGVSVGGVTKTVGSDYSITGDTVTFTTAPASGTANVKLYRNTDIDNPEHEYSAGSSITAARLNENQRQALYAIEEAKLVTTTSGGITTGNKNDITVNSDTDWVIRANAVEKSMMADNSVGTDEIETNAVTAAELADNAVDTNAIVNLNVTTGKIANDAVNGTKIADDSIDSEHIVADSIDTEHYAPGSVDSNAIADNAITAPKTDLSIVQGDIVYGTGTNAWDRLAKGAAGQQIRINNGATAPEWFTSNIQSNVYVKGYGIASGGITTPAAGAAVSGNLTIDTAYDTPITVTITPQVSSSLIVLNTHMMYEGIADYAINFRIKAEVLNNSDVVQSTSYLTNNYTGSAIHNSGSTANGVASSGYENKGANLNTGIEGSNRVPILTTGSTDYNASADDHGATPSSLNIQGLLHNPGSVVTPNKIKYTLQIVMRVAGVFYINRTVADTDTLEYERGVSWFTAQETMGNITVDV